ncbi:MAG: FixH family protein [Pseudomonadota bacterium]
MYSAPTHPLRTTAPWYAQRWPWLLMLGPALVVVAGSFTAYLAYTRQDAMVVDDYYKRGKAINQDLRRDRVASAMRLSVEARYDAAAGMLRGEVTSFGRALATPLHISLAHSTLPEKDLSFDAVPDAQGHFEVALPMLERARWQMAVEGERRDWRLAAQWRWPAQKSVRIDADPAIVK